MKRSPSSNTPFVLGLVLLAGLSCAPSAHAQLPWRWFGPRFVDKAPPIVKAVVPDSQRIAEVNVEVAWLADPITFPYYLEARVVNSLLEMRGYVPNKAVREHALRIAQVVSSLPVTDTLREHPSLLVRPSTMSPQQLQSIAHSSLRVALPKQFQQFTIECGKDGKVSVAGPVNSHEEKIAVSHALRRLQGCTSVQNLTTLPAELAQNPPSLMLKDKAPLVKASNPDEPKSAKPIVTAQDRPPEVKSRWLFWPFNKVSTARDAPARSDELKQNVPEKKEGPIAIPNFADRKASPDVIMVESPDAPDKTPASAPTPAELQKSILAVCKQAKGVEVLFTAANEVRITIEIRNDNDVAPAAGAILAMPELRNYRPDLLFKVVAP